jgi:hypothetical protein
VTDEDDDSRAGSSPRQRKIIHVDICIDVAAFARLPFVVDEQI